MNALINIAIALTRENLYALVNNLTSNATNKFERKISGKHSRQILVLRRPENIP